MKTASWVIVEKTTGRAVFETFNFKLTLRVNREKYDVLPIYQYLCSLNELTGEK